MYMLSGLSICLALFGACLISRKNQKSASTSTYFTDTLPRSIFEDVKLPVQLFGSTKELNSAIKLTDLVDVRYGHHLLGSLGSYFYMTQINQIHLKELRKKKKALSLLIIPEYDLYLAGMLLLSCVFMVPFVFIYDWLTIKGYNANQISIVLLMNGVFGGFARLFIGIISNMKCSRTVIILLFWLAVSGILSISCTYFNEPWQYAIYSAIDGICCGAYSVLQPLVLVEILSRDHITQGLGILLFVCGLGYLFGVPILAIVYDQWKSYELCYRICGIICLTASGLVFTIWMLSYRKVRLEMAELKLKQNLERSYQMYNRSQTDSSSSTSQLKDIE
ncbi:unnamed protein product [Trichobilharzia szidati]|nr:unnamed protein product [Trichobilharzia szidati]